MTRIKKNSEAAVDHLVNWEKLSPVEKNSRSKRSLDEFVEAERRSPGHFLLEKAIADLCAANGLTPLTNKHIDLLVQGDLVSVVFEVKTCGLTDIGSRVRLATYQLLEYRYLYRDVLRSEVRLCVVSDHRPRGGSGWLMGYLDYLRIGVIWRNEHDDGLGCSDFTKTILGDFFPQIREWQPERVLRK
jgi:hypothetical protein